LQAKAAVAQKKAAKITAKMNAIAKKTQSRLDKTVVQ